ncbi:hypothetical protein OBBRIDRAFT_114667 [Obba rivulosa]|uniref:Uncharacterized protein n=1 Tax=Obba rivulosa TaxID=1052685 RepID=A0A8E2AYX0_9APHY|nr:hypothetical protein OBBRIDRAFT_114667 [Obba rivulosa]
MNLPVRAVEDVHIKFTCESHFNLDTLCYLMWFLNRRELLASIMTCQTLYSAWTAILFTLPIDVRNHFKPSCFCKCVRHDLADRSRCLRRHRLNLSHYDYVINRGCVRGMDHPKSVVKQLIDILFHAESLHKLDIELNKRTLELYPELSLAMDPCKIQTSHRHLLSEAGCR